jgi:putative SOS response-associated peptidase YedK
MTVRFSDRPHICGCFTQAYTWRELVAFYRLTQPAADLQAHYNIAPTSGIDVVIPQAADRREFVSMRWGLMPSWWNKTAKEVPYAFSARAETVAINPMFRAAYKRSRCVIPASGYYTWKATRTGKQPYYISARDGSPLSFAGLWDEWRDPETGKTTKSCTIIVTGANKFTRWIHDRMPAILARKQLEAWLSGSPAARLLRPAPEGALRMWEVSRRVNRVGNDNDPSLIEAIQRAAHG